MAALLRMRVIWTGVNGLPGVSTFYGDPTSTAVVTAVRDFFDDIKGVFPGVVTWQFPNEGDIIDDANGGLLGSWNTSSMPPLFGTLGSSYHAAGVGVRAVWNTGVVVGKRRLRGSTFLTNVGAGFFDSDGTLNGTAMNALQTAADDLAATGLLRVWHRNSPGGSDGVAHAVTSASIPDRITSLRSRRY